MNKKHFIICAIFCLVSFIGMIAFNLNQAQPYKSDFEKMKENLPEVKFNFGNLRDLSDAKYSLSLSQFNERLNSGFIEELGCISNIDNHHCYGLFKDGKAFFVVLPDITLYESKLLKNDVKFYISNE